MTALEGFFQKSVTEWVERASVIHMFCAKPVVGKQGTCCLDVTEDFGKMSRNARNLLPRKKYIRRLLIFQARTPMQLVFSMTLGFAKSTAEKVYRFPVLYGRSGGPFKEKLWSGCRTPK